MADTFNAIAEKADNTIIDTVGVTVTVKDNNGGYIGSVVGVFDKPYIDTLNIQGFVPTFTYQDSALTIADNYEITHLSQAYNVRIVEDDGTGMVTLILGEK